jgi:predicted nucleic acid-binding protein
VKVIVDANMVFSAILNTNGKVGELLINSHKLIDFMAPEFLRTEIRKYHKRLTEISKLSLEAVIEAEYLVCKDIKFISEEQVSLENWEAAYDLVKDIDEKDVH